MQPVVLLPILTFSALAVLSSAKEQRFFGSLGQPLHLQLKPNAEKHDVSFYKSSKIIYELKNFTATFHDLSVKQRWAFDIVKGSITITSTERKDSGTYRMEAAGEIERFKVIIQAVVSYAILSPVCQGGRRRVQCSADGDSTQYSWLVDGVSTTANLSADSRVVSLDGEAVGNLTCIANNSVSSAKVSVPLWAPCSGMEAFCDATKNGTCYGTLGKPVYLQMSICSMACQNKLDKEQSNSTKTLLLMYRRSKLTILNLSARGRVHFRVDSKTLVVNSAQRSDSGTYSVAMYGEESGLSHGLSTVHLTIEAAVSSVSLTFICLSQEAEKVICSSNGDGLWYSWSLDGKPLDETELVTNASDDGHAIILRKHTDGNLTCTVTNHISSASITQQPRPCIAVLFWYVWAAEIVILMCLNVGGHCCYMRKILQQPAKREDQEMELQERQETVREEDHMEQL